MANTTYSHLIIEEREGTAIVTIHRPEALNALNRAVLEELQTLFQALKSQERIRSIVITGSGEKAFVAGADVKEILELSYEDAVSFSQQGQRLFDFIAGYSKPVIAAINGYALGGGCELAMACHIRFASTTAKLGLPEINLGLIPGYGGTQRLAQLIGATKAYELILTGEHISAEEALRLGLVNHIFPPEELLPNTLAFAKKLNEKAPLAVMYAIEAVNAGLLPDKNGYEVEVIGFAKVASSDDGKEGIRAFLEKRKPHFRGN